MLTPKQKLNDLLDELYLGDQARRHILDHVEAHWTPKPIAAADPAPPPVGPGNLAD